MKTISIKGILQDLENGLTRTVSSQGYDATVGSIETKYELSKADVKSMFEHELLKNRKTRKAPSFRLVDDVTPVAAPEPVNDVAESNLANEIAVAPTPEVAPPVPSTGVSYATRPQGSAAVAPTPEPVAEVEVSLPTPVETSTGQF